MGFERRALYAVTRRVGVFAGLQQPVEGHHAADVQTATYALDHGHPAEAVTDGCRRERLVDGGMRESVVQPLAEQRAEQFVVVIHGD